MLKKELWASSRLGHKTAEQNETINSLGLLHQQLNWLRQEGARMSQDWIDVKVSSVIKMSLVRDIYFNIWHVRIISFSNTKNIYIIIKCQLYLDNELWYILVQLKSVLLFVIL